MNKDARLVSADEFKKVYDFDRTALSHADYLGKKDGFHYIAVFHPGDGSRAQYQYSIRAREEELPLDFPRRPQKPVSRLGE